MHKIFLSLLILFSINKIILAQQVIELASMPEKVSNNAVCQAKVGSEYFVYSFAGIDQTKEYAGIHKRAFRYSTSTDTWEAIEDLPSGNGRIAAGASVVKNKIYIIGGYEVFDDGAEISYDKVHVYDPVSNEYLPDGKVIPIPIDDHIQAVWRDSLIYVVTGWSTDDNVPDVQIYNPSKDEWLVGTPTPDNSTYKAFGASGVIIDDTIYFCGGVRNLNGNFGSSNALRVGIINPADPTQITWSSKTSISTIGYRMAAAYFNDSKPIWIGGGTTGYNFDGLAYGSGQGVEPMPRILEYSPELEQFTINSLAELQVMDLRGSAQLSPSSIIICGGMAPGQEISDKTFLIDISLVPNVEIHNENGILVTPNPANDFLQIEGADNGRIEIYSLEGKVVLSDFIESKLSIDISALAKGLYFLVYFVNDKKVFTEKLSIVK